MRCRAVQASCGRPDSLDSYETPSVALNPLLPYLPHTWTIWEPACGQGRLVDALVGHGYEIVASDIVTGHDFLYCEPHVDYDAIVTNPPFSQAIQFLSRAYELGKPFALLMPLTKLETEPRQALFAKHGVDLIALPKRIEFMPDKGAVWFAVAWFTYGLPGMQSQSRIVFASME